MAAIIYFDEARTFNRTIKELASIIPTPHKLLVEKKIHDSLQKTCELTDCVLGGTGQTRNTNADLILNFPFQKLLSRCYNTVHTAIYTGRLLNAT